MKNKEERREKKEESKEKRQQDNNLVFIFSLFIILFSFIFTSCREMLEPPQVKTGKGMGTFTLSVAGAGQNEQKARAIMPNTDTKQFVKYKLVFTPSDGDAIIVYIDDLSESVVLPSETYTLTVTAYTYFDGENSTDNKAAATGQKSNVVIPNGSGAAASIELTPLTAEEDAEGTFSWNISFETTPLWAYMEIENQPDTDAFSKNYILAGSPTGVIGTEFENDSITIPAGDYRVVLHIKKDTATREITWRETLHVYQNLESCYSYEFKDAHFTLNVYDVTLNYNGGGTDSTLTYWHGATNYAPVAPTWTGYTFGGWYEDAGFENLLELEDGDLPALIGPLILYAKWEEVISNAELVLSQTVLDFGKQKHGYSTASKTFTITNVGGSNANTVTIGFENATTAFSLSTDTTSINAGSYATITVTLVTGKAVGNYDNTIIVTYTAGSTPVTLTLPVKFEVLPRWSGIAQADNSFNSNNLLNIPSPEYGWYSKTVQGIWKKGFMIQTGEEQVIDVPMTTQTFSFNRLDTVFNGTWKDLAGGIGRWYGTTDGSGGNNITTVDVEIYIPHDSYLVWFQYPVENPTDFVYASDDGKFRMPTGGGSQTWCIKIKIEANSSWIYKEDEFHLYAYPIFQQENNPIYYWQIRECNSDCLPGCLVKDHVNDNWNISGEDVNILEFNVLEHNQDGTIKIRAYDTSEAGVSFMAASPDYLAVNDVNDLDILLPNLTEEYYRSPISYPILVDEENVGSISVVLTGHTQVTGTTTLSRVDIKVVYNLNPEFASYVESFTCNGYTVGSTNTITLTNLNHGPLTLNTVFTFEDGN